MPFISVILPVYNDAQYVREALESIRASIFADYELIVVDDGSDDGSRAIIEEFLPDLLIVNETNKGHHYSRNLAARKAQGEILFFTDADVSLQNDTLEKIHRHFTGKHEYDAVIGVYQLPSGDTNICSLYKNAWIRYSYLIASDNAQWFFTAIGAVRSSAWESVGGFDDRLTLKNGGGDVDFGRKLVKQQCRILLDKTIECAHRKRFTLKSLLANDFNRAYGYASVWLKRWNRSAPLQQGFANISPGFIISSLLAAAMFLAAIAGAVCPAAMYVNLLIVVIYCIANRDFYRYIMQSYGLRIMWLTVVLMFADHLVCFAGVVRAAIGYGIQKTGFLK